MTPTAHDLGLAYQRVVRRRSILLATHVVLGLIAGFIYMSRQDFSHLAYWRRVGNSSLISHLTASWPYVLSGASCYWRGGITSRGLIAFEAILVAGTSIGAALYLGVLGVRVEGIWVLVLTFLQAFFFLAAAGTWTADPPSGPAGG